MRNQFHGAACCLFSVVSWGTMFPIMDSALSTVNPFFFTAIRYTLAAALFSVLLYWKEGKEALRLDRGPAVAWMLGSLGFAGFGSLVFFGQQLAGKAGAVNASVIMALMPMMSVLVNWGFRKVRPLKWSLCFVAMSFIGVLLVATRGDFASLISLQRNVTANVVIMAGALCWVIYTIGGSVFADWSALRYTTLTTILGVTTIWGVNVALFAAGHNDIPNAAAVGAIWPHLCYMVLVAGFLGVLAWNVGNKILTPINGVLFMDLVPVTTFVIAALMGYAFNVAELIGASLTLSALVINNLYQRRRAT